MRAWGWGLQGEGGRSRSLFSGVSPCGTRVGSLDLVRIEGEIGASEMATGTTAEISREQ